MTRAASSNDVPSAPVGKSSSHRITNGLVALSSAAVLTVYSAGYLRTRSAADRFVVQAAERRPPDPKTERVPAPLTAPAHAAVTPAPVTAPAATAAPATAAPVTAAPTTLAPAPIATPVAKPAAETSPAPSKVASPSVPLATPTKPATSVVAEASAPAPESAAAPAPSPYKDGNYLGWGTSRHGDIQAGVVIQGGRITQVSIAQCLTRYSCSWIVHLLPQVIARQSADVDFVSGATQSVNALYYAVLDALSQAK